MTYDECERLLRQARAVLDRCMFEADGETMRDDVAEIGMKIDEAIDGAAEDSAELLREASEAA